MFKCKKCGKCCSNLLPLTKKEIQVLKKLAKKENKLLVDKYWYNSCPFLNLSLKCDIYENRPTICREFDCNKFKNQVVSNNMIKNLKQEKYTLVDLRKEIFGGDKK